MTAWERVAVGIGISVLLALFAGALWLGDLIMRADSASRGPDGVLESGDEGAFYEP